MKHETRRCISKQSSSGFTKFRLDIHHSSFTSMSYTLVHRNSILVIMLSKLSANNWLLTGQRLRQMIQWYNLAFATKTRKKETGTSTATLTVTYYLITSKSMSNDRKKSYSRRGRCNLSMGGIRYYNSEIESQIQTSKQRSEISNVCRE